MRFADPHACPSCGGSIAGESRCPQCHLDLSSPASLKLWQVLIQADSLLDQARRESVAVSPIPTGSAAESPPSHPDLPSAVPVAAPSRNWSTGSIILGLGALCLVVAALIFITVSWSVLGPTGRTMVLLVITLAFAGAAAWSTRAGLRASAESFWAIFFALLTIDFFAARAYGLLGLDAFSREQAALVFGILATAVGGAVVLASRKTLPVVAPSVAGGLAVWVASFSLAALVDWSYFWNGFAALVLASIGAGIAWRLALTLIARISAAAVAVHYLIAASGAIEEITDSPHLAELTRDGHGIPMLVMIALTGAIGVAESRLAIPAAALVTLGSASLVFAPSETASPHEGGFLAGSVLAVALSFALIRGTSSWVRGARISAALITAALATASLAWLANAIDAVGRSNSAGFGTSWTIRLTNHEDLPGPGWLAIVALGSVAVSVFAALRWPEVRTQSGPFSLVPPLFAALGIVVGVIAFEPLVLIAALLVLAAGIGLLVLARKAPASREGDVWLAIALFMTVLPAEMAFGSKPVALLVWLAVAATLAAVAALFSRDWARQASSFGATALVISAATLAADLASLGDAGIRITAAVASILALAAASFILREFVGRPTVEIAAGLGMLGALSAALEMTLGLQALIWTIVGASLVVIALTVNDRRWLRYVGSAALGVAWVIRLLASDVDTIEAYTAPFAVVLLGAGLWSMRGNPQLRTVIALTPGLTLAFVPSLPQALADPTGPRALSLGLAGLVALAIGIWRKWQMPFVYGSFVVALVVLWNVGPLANGLPRWILIAVAGVILIGSGFTWENRVHNARSAAQYVQNLR